MYSETNRKFGIMKELESMKKYGKTLILTLTLALIFVMIPGCSAPVTTTTAAPATSASDTQATTAQATVKGGTIAVTIPTAQSPFCNNFALGVVAAAESLGYTGLIDDPQVNLENQITAIENFVTSGVKGIVVFPVDGTGVDDAAKAAMAAGVPIVAYDNKMSADFYVTEDENNTGKILAQAGIDWALANTDGTVEIAILAPDEAEDSHNGRVLVGMQSAITEKLPNAKVVSIQKSSDSTEVMTLLENVLTANPNVKLIYCQLDEIVAYEALNSLGYNRDDVCLVGASGTDDAMKVIAKGEVLRATIYNDIYTTGFNAGLAAIALSEGKTPDPVGVEYKIVNADNVDDYVKP